MAETAIGPEPGRPYPAAPMYGSRAVGTSPLNVAFLGRVSDEELQDPTLSLPRQATSCQTVLPPGARIVAYYWDIESGRMDPSRRGRSDSYKKFSVPLPRDGGIRDLLDAAAGEPAFDAVICEAIDRVARRTYYGVKIEHDLERCGVPLLAADEGIQNLRKRATQILTRRVKQATAEWYVLETLEKAWDGFCEHATQGWNIGVPPYGYLAERLPHPVPAKRAAGTTKTRLAWDPIRAPVIQKIFEWRVIEKKSRQDIANLLNNDPDLYPPPTANDGRRTRGSWCASTVMEILDNPKYTGFMVWNRRARNTARGKRNPPELWVWSPGPTHKPIISLNLYKAAADIGKARQGSRSARQGNKTTPNKRFYLFRSFVRCAICTRRMEPTTRKKDIAYLRCRIRPTDRSDAAQRWPRHPADLYLPERALLDGILDFFADRVYGQDRRYLFDRELAEADKEARREWQEKIDAVERSLDDLQQRRRRLLNTIETTDDLNPELREDINRRSAEISNDRVAKRRELADLRAHPPTQTGSDTDLFDLLGSVTRTELALVPDELLRDLFEAYGLEITYDAHANSITCMVNIDDHNLPIVSSVTSAIQKTPNPTSGLGVFDVRSEGIEPPTF